MQGAAKSQAYLSSNGNYTSFTSGKHVIRFRTPSSLERYTSVKDTEVKEWDHGYLVVMAKYKNSPCEEEEYIDLVPILKNLYFDVDRFLAPIEGVSIRYDQ